MAYPLSLGLLSSGVAPAPAHPVVRRAAVGSLFRLGPLLTLTLAMVIGVFGFVSPSALFTEDMGASHLVVVVAVVIGGNIAIAVTRSIRRALVTIFGYAGVRARRELCPRAALPIRRMFGFAGLAGGLLIAVVGRVLADDLWYAGAALVLLSLAVFGMVRAWPRARQAWREMQAERARQAAIMSRAEPVVGRLAEVRWSQRWLGECAVVHADLVFEYRGQTQSFPIDVVDYPVWAPTEGNEFDVWIDPAAPLGPDNIMVRRRYVGQRFVPDPLEYRLPGTGDSSPGPIAPSWMFDRPGREDKVSSKASPAIRFGFALLPMLVAAAATATAILAPFQVRELATTSQVVLWMYALANLYNGALYLLYQRRSRLLVRSGVGLTGSNVVAASTLVAGIWAVVLSPSLVDAPLQLVDSPRWTATHVMVLVSLAGSILAFWWTFITMDKVERHFNGETPAPAEVVQEALKSPDPGALDELERRYGYRAGAFLLVR